MGRGASESAVTLRVCLGIPWNTPPATLPQTHSTLPPPLLFLSPIPLTWNDVLPILQVVRGHLFPKTFPNSLKLNTFFPKTTAYSLNSPKAFIIAHLSQFALICYRHLWVGPCVMSSLRSVQSVLVKMLIYYVCILFILLYSLCKLFEVSHLLYPATLNLFGHLSVFVKLGS